MAVGGTSVSAGRPRRLPRADQMSTEDLIWLARNPGELEKVMKQLAEAQAKHDEAAARHGVADQIDAVLAAAGKDRETAAIELGKARDEAQAIIASADEMASNTIKAADDYAAAEDQRLSDWDIDLRDRDNAVAACEEGIKEREQKAQELHEQGEAQMADAKHILEKCRKKMAAIEHALRTGESLDE